MCAIKIPRWVRALVDKHGGSDPLLIMTKSLTACDLNLQHENRLLIPSQHVEVLLHPAASRNMPGTGRVQGTKHGGLEVWVDSRSGFRCLLMLTRWDATGSTVIKGTEYEYLLNRNFHQENVLVELWGFRQGEEGKLCFALGKKTQ